MLKVSEYNEMVNQHSDGLYRYALKNLKDKDEAKDIVQSTFEKLWNKRETVKVETLKSYLYAIAHNAIVDKWRANKRFTNTEVLETKSVQAVEYTGIKALVDKALNNLPETQKQVLLLRDYEGYSYEEIGEIMKLNASQVKVYIFRARNTIKNYIGTMEKAL